jgi:hypothetical protein
MDYMIRHPRTLPNYAYYKFVRNVAIGAAVPIVVFSGYCKTLVLL